MSIEKNHPNEYVESPKTTLATEQNEFNPDKTQRLAEEEREKKERIVGAKVLTAAGFNRRHQKIVDSSFEKARKAKQKLVGNNDERRNRVYVDLVGNNDERRNGVYVDRIKDIVGRYGEKAEQRLWGFSSASDELVVKPENVPDSFWESQAQIRRDNGMNEYISDYEKKLLVEDARKRQRESIKSWSDYLSQKDCPYPMWFKLFAWDGVTKMSAVYDKDSQRFAKHDKTTMAPYPHLNPAVLAQIYDVICSVNGLDESDETGKPNLDEETEIIAKTYNFNKLYSLILSKQKVALEVPKDPENVHGDWVEYRHGDEKALAAAAAGTPWCIASPVVGKNYLAKGHYGTGEIEETENKARFILFHLRDEDTGELTSSACASIRLDTDGNVAEISGLQNGQVLDDALVPVVERKVRSLPGGKRYLEAFADKRELIRLDKKMQAGEKLTNDELRFIYELDRPIHKIEQYGEDIRIEEAKQKYPPSGLIKRKIANVRDLKKIMKREPMDDVTLFIDAGVRVRSIINDGEFGIQDVDKLLERNISHKDIIDIFKQQGEWIFENFDFLTSRGFTAMEIVKQTSSSTLLEHLDFLDKNNIPYNLRNLMRKATKQHNDFVILKNSKTILAHDGRINFERIAKRMDPQDIIRYADSFCDSGHRKIVERAMRKMKDSEEPHYYNYVISQKLKALLDGGVEIANLEEIVNSPNRNIDQVILSLDALLERDINVKIEISDLTNAFMGEKETAVIFRHPERFNPKEVYKIMPRWAVVKYFDKLIENGIEIDIEKLAKTTPRLFKILYIKTFEKYGVKIDMDSEISKLDGDTAFYLMKHYLNDENTPVVRENIDKIATILLSNIKNSKELEVAAKPLLWRLGYIR